MYFGGLSMSKFDAVSLQTQIFNNSKIVVPLSSILTWISTDKDSDVRYYSSAHEIAASATNETISLDEDTNTAVTLIWIDDASDTNITVKTNGDATGMSVPRILSGALTGLTVTNADVTNTKDLLIGRIVTSATNTTLKESR
jgi:hypothetical protein